ncbi:hypothetical protein ACQCSX_14720 [Pseudarthrobacter sp. P1]|uniref:hypothetical protein n=1 Tax=Pseudarthrobacter sp. P1 TaxID=3418418 RepID=UPI003CEAC267
MRQVRKIRIHWPINGSSLAGLAAGKTEAFESDEDMRLLLELLRSTPQLGDFGVYSHVFEAGIGFEGFTTGAGANPTLGMVGERTVSPTIIFTTYLDADTGEELLQVILSRLVGVHPWEIPVIELSEPFHLVARQAAGAQDLDAALPSHRRDIAYATGLHEQS